MNAPKNPAPKAAATKAAATTPVSVDADALTPAKPDSVDTDNIEVLSEAKRNGKTVRVVTDGRAVWKEVA